MAQGAVDGAKAIAVGNVLLHVELDSAINLQKQGAFKDALRLLQAAIEKGARAPGAAQDTILALAYHKAGVSYYMLDQNEAAVEHFEQALNIRKAVFPIHHPDVIRGYNNIGNVYLWMGEQEKAAPYLHESLDRQPEPPINPYPATVQALGRLYNDLKRRLPGGKNISNWHSWRANVFRRKQFGILLPFKWIWPIFISIRKKYKQALSAAHEVLSLRMKVADKNHRDSSGIAVAYTTIFRVHEKLNRLDSAFFYESQALKWNQRIYPSDHPKLATNYHNLALVHFGKKEYERAKIELKKSDPN